MLRTRMALAGVTLAALAQPGLAHADLRYSVASGLDYASGDYGADTRTEIVSTPFIVRLSEGPWALRAATSYLEITGPADVVDSEGGAEGGSLARTGSERGLGDTNVALSYTFRRLGGSHLYFETIARVRLPTGDEDKGLGVGAIDYGLGTEVGLNRSDGGASFELTRRFLGERAGLDREDGWQTNAAAWLRPNASTQIGVFGYWREASVSGGEEPAQLGAFLGYELASGLRVGVNVSAGLSDASADYAAGLRFTWRGGKD